MGFLQRCEMRDLRETEDLLKLVRILQDGNNPAVVGPEELLQGQHGQQLVLGEVALGEF